eukprot:4050597-Prymnesium_polylepis.1
MVAILHVPMLRRDPRGVCQTVKPRFGRVRGPTVDPETHLGRLRAVVTLNNHHTTPYLWRSDVSRGRAGVAWRAGVARSATVGSMTKSPRDASREYRWAGGLLSPPYTTLAR